MAKITAMQKWLEDDKGNIIIPRTLIDCIFDSSGTSLKSKLEYYASVQEEIESIQSTLNDMISYLEVNTPLLVDSTYYLVDDDGLAFIVDNDIKSNLNELMSIVSSSKNMWEVYNTWDVEENISNIDTDTETEV